jgi:hypothetical protein
VYVYVKFEYMILTLTLITHSRVFLQLMQHGVVAVLEDQVQFALPTEHLNQVDQIRML